MLRIPSVHREEDRAEKDARALLNYVGLRGKQNELARNLSYGDQRRLEIARALATEPRLLLLDEPTAGMNPIESRQMVDFIRRLRDERGATILLIEHQMRVVMGVCEYIHVLDYGEKIAEGTPAEVQSNEQVIEAYLGRGRQLAMSLLEVSGVVAGYGGITALKGISFTVEEGEIVTLIGNNGAGKTTTLLRTISGLVRPRTGDVLFADRPILHAAAQNRPAGHFPIARGPRHLFAPQRLREPRDGRIPAQGQPQGGHGTGIRAFPRLKERRSQAGGTLSGASNRCWRSAGRSWRGPAFSYSTSPRWASRRSWSRRFSAQWST